MSKDKEGIFQQERGLEISRILRGWYETNKRDLPWRNTNNPYVIWISEIILQQTRVNQGLDYFLRFINRFPDVVSLAAASEEEVLKYWQGLGYYSRARNLHAAAKSIVTRFDGAFPAKYEDVLSLKGVGGYTAAAIVSFAWNMPFPVVDGNVFRVLSRLFAVSEPIDSGAGKRLFTELAGEVMDEKHAGMHNQAIMEFGALQCAPQSPSCGMCPLNHKCMAYASGMVSSYPVKQQKIKSRNRYFHYFHVVYKNEFVYLNRRTGDDIWKGLFEFPMVETDRPVDFAALSETESFRSLFDGIKDLHISVGLSDKKHVLSHQVLYANFYRVDIDTESEGLAPYLKVPLVDVENYAVPRLVHIYLEKLA